MKQTLFGLFVVFLLVGIIPATAQVDFSSITIVPLRYEPCPAQPGEYMRLWINLENEGIEKAENLVVILEPKYPFYLDESENATREIKTLVGLDNTIIDYKIRVASDAVSGENELKLKYSTKDREVWVEKKLKINIQTLDVTLDVVSVESNEVEPGETTNLKIKLKNGADSYLRDINVKLEFRETFSGGTLGETTVIDYPFSPINSTGERKIYLIESGQEKTIAFNLLASPDAACGPYKVPLTITYYDSTGEEYIKSDFITLIVSAEPEITVGLEDSEILSSGQTGTITLNIINKGLTGVKYLTINLKQGNYEILSLPEIYIGNLDTDDYDTTEFRIYAESNEKELPLKIKLSYRDDNNKEYSEEQTVSLRLYTQEELQKYNLVPAQSNTSLIILVVVVLVVGYWFYKKRKKHRR